jgi:hypothetical protein
LYSSEVPPLFLSVEQPAATKRPTAAASMINFFMRKSFFALGPTFPKAL